MSILTKPVGYLAAFAATAGVAGCGAGVNGQGADVAVAAQDARPVELPRPPIKIPMPLDKAGIKVDVTFEVPPLVGERLFGVNYFSGFIGLRVLFTPGSSEVRVALENYPPAARISLHRIEDDGKETRIPLFSRTKRPPPGVPPSRGEVFEIPEGGEVIAILSSAEHTAAPPGIPNDSTFVLSFASDKTDVTPGVYRLQVETLADIPALSGITSFLVYEEYPDR